MWNRSMVLLLNLFLQHMSITICHNFLNYFGTSDFVLPFHYWWVCWSDTSFQKLKLESQFYPCNGFPLHAWFSHTRNFSKTFSTSCFLVVYTTYWCPGVSTLALLVDVSLHGAICSICLLRFIVKTLDITNAKKWWRKTKKIHNYWIALTPPRIHNFLELMLV